MPELRPNVKIMIPLVSHFHESLYFTSAFLNLCIFNFLLLVVPYSESAKDQQRLYVWGMAEHGALGDLKIRSRENRIQFIYRPVRLKFAYSYKV